MDEGQGFKARPDLHCSLSGETTLRLEANRERTATCELPLAASGKQRVRIGFKLGEDARLHLQRGHDRRQGSGGSQSGQVSALPYFEKTIAGRTNPARRSYGSSGSPLEALDRTP